MNIQLIDPYSGKVVFDSNKIAAESLDPERDHIASGAGWTMQTREQLHNQMKRDGYKTCPSCDSLALVMDNREWACMDCRHVWPYESGDLP